MKKISVKAPCRVDFAGGTVDLWPLYLYLGGLELVHMAISVKAEAKLSYELARGRKKQFFLEVKSSDLNCSQDYHSLEELNASLSLNTKENPLRWINRLAYYFLYRAKFSGHVIIETRSDAPPGSGLGGSSVLGIAIAQAFEKALSPASKRLKAWDLQRTVRDLEAIEIEHPAGDQDYVPALFGGLLIFKLGPNSREVEKVPSSTARYLSDRSALIYTGKPHHSGLNNWQIFMDFHNGNAKIRAALNDIKTLSSEFAEALRKKNTSRFAELINQEWKLRQSLSPAVCAPVLDEAWNFARSLGASARKACGSGGGGCLLVYFDSPAAKTAALKKALPQSDWKWLDASIAT